MKHSTNFILLCMLAPVLVHSMESGEPADASLPESLKHCLERMAQTHRLRNMGLIEATYHNAVPLSPAQCQTLYRALERIPFNYVSLGDTFNCCFTSDELVRGIAARVPAMATVHTVSLSPARPNAILNQRAELIAHMLVKMRHTQAVDFSGCDLVTPTPYTHRLLRVLACARFTHADLSCNWMGLADAPTRAHYLAMLAALPHTLAMVQMHNCGLAVLDAPAWQLFEPVFRKVKNVDLGWNSLWVQRYALAPMTEDACRAFGRVLSSSSIEVLGLSFNALNAAPRSVWQTLAETFALMPHLRVLDLRGNNMAYVDRDRLELLAVGLRRNHNRPVLVLAQGEDVDDFLAREGRLGLPVLFKKPRVFSLIADDE